MTIEELKQAYEAATPGPWSWRADINAGEWNLSPGVLIASETDGTRGGDEIDQANARLIVAAVNNLPKLLKVVEAAQGAVTPADYIKTPDEDLYAVSWERLETLRKALEEMNDE